MLLLPGIYISEMEMKKVFLLLVLLSSCAGMFAQDRASVIRQKLINRDESSVIVAAHRGDWRNFPENSLEAIDNAIKMGVDIVEIDVQRTKDGVLILMHDHNIDRTTSGGGNIAELTYDSIANTRLRNGCGIHTIHKVPTLEEALLHAKGKIMLNLDKADRYFEQIYELLKKTGTAKQIIMKGRKSAEEVKKLYGAYLDDVIYMPIVDLDQEDAEKQIKEFMSEMDPVAFELSYGNEDNTLPVKAAKMMKGKSLIWYNTLWASQAGGHDDDMSLQNPNLGYGYLIDNLGTRIIQTDRPQYLLEYLRTRNLHD